MIPATVLWPMYGRDCLEDALFDTGFLDQSYHGTRCRGLYEPPQHAHRSLVQTIRLSHVWGNRKAAKVYLPISKEQKLDIIHQGIQFDRWPSRFAIYTIWVLCIQTYRVALTEIHEIDITAHCMS